MQHKSKQTKVVSTDKPWVQRQTNKLGLVWTGIGFICVINDTSKDRKQKAHVNLQRSLKARESMVMEVHYHLSFVVREGNTSGPACNTPHTCYVHRWPTKTHKGHSKIDRLIQGS